MSPNGQIQRRFARAAQSYDQFSLAQQTICQQALGLLPQQPFNHIVDMACGTGYSTYCLAQKLLFNCCYGVDFAKPLLALAKEKYSQYNNIYWLHGDFDQQINFQAPVDLLFCNMGLQWSRQIHKTLRLWRTYLSTGGWLLFSVPTKNNFPELKSECKPDFLEHQQWLEQLSASGWHLHHWSSGQICQRFTSALAALKSLKATGVNQGKGLIQKGLSRIDPDSFFVQPDLPQLTYCFSIYLARG